MDSTELWPGGPRFRQAGAFPLGTDSVLLADFACHGGAKRGIDLGCGSGILALLLAWKNEGLELTGLELQPAAAEVARENLAQNGLAGRCRVLTGDIRQHRALFSAGSFDFAIANPPYFAARSGASSPAADRAAAREEEQLTLSELAAAAAWLLRFGGALYLVYRPERLSELLVTLSARGLEPKRLRLVSQRADSAPSLVLLEARRGGRPGLRLEPLLVLQNPDGSESAEYRRIYHL